jgi:hypothetical protein
MLTLEVNKLNIFCLLLSSGLYYIIEYLNESLSKKGFSKTSTNEFCRFLGTFCLLSSFNLSMELNWNLKQKITGDKVMSKDCFNELITNFRGFEMGIRMGEGPSAWCDQRAKFQKFHFLQDRIFEHS